MSDLLDMPPQNLEAEQSVLGSMLLDKNAIVHAQKLLHPEDFYRDAHRALYQAICDLFDKGEAVDLVTLAEELRRRGSLEETGGLGYLTQVLEAVPTAANVEQYAKIVAEKSRLRQVIRICQVTLQAAYAPDAEAPAVLDGLTQAATALEAGVGADEIKLLGDVTALEVQRLYGERDMPSLLTTGFMGLDRLLGGGLRPGALYVVGARPAMGKTSFARQVAHHAAGQSKTVLFLSLEMTAEDLGLSLASTLAGVDFQRLQTRRLNPTGWDDIKDKANDLKNLPFFVDDRAGLALADVRAQCRWLKVRQGLDLVLLDYLQLAGSGAGKEETRDRELTRLAYGLKALAKELRVPVLALAQVGRAVEGRHNKRPALADLRESGGIEAAADCVMFLYRDAYYDPDSPDKASTELIVAKQRLGPTGVVYLHWSGDRMTFHNLATTLN